MTKKTWQMHAITANNMAYRPITKTSSADDDADDDDDGCNQAHQAESTSTAMCFHNMNRLSRKNISNGFRNEENKFFVNKGEIPVNFNLYYDNGRFESFEMDRSTCMMSPLESSRLLRMTRKSS